MTGLKEHNTVKLKWQGATCTFTVALPPGTVDEVVRPAPVVCPGLKR